MIARLVLAAAIVAGPAWAASPAAETPAPADAAPAVDPLPRSMRPQGVIGRLPEGGDYSILEPDILTRMRDALARLGEIPPG